MNIQKFFAKNSREALQQVKRALGGDAVILSNRSVSGGVEMLAVAHLEAQALVTEDRQAAQSVHLRNAVGSAHVNPASRGAQISTASIGKGSQRTNAQRAQPQPRSFAAKSSDTDTDSVVMARQVISEIKSMRGAIESQLFGLVWSDLHKRDPGRAYLLRDLLASGFSPALTRNLVERLPAGSASELNRWAKKALAKNLGVAMDDEIVTRGGVYALTGPTGVGKTTTTAKLAARCVVRHGADKLALLTTDSYRIGAFEHLKIYGRILGVSGHAARDEHELRSSLANLRGKHIVLIDTIGMSQRDKQVAEQVAMLANAGPVQRLLLLNATCHGDTLEDVVRVYGRGDLAGCILTKADEAPSIGAALDVIIRHKLKLHFVANGQRVPEDLHPAKKEYLVDRALRRAESELTGEEGAQMAALLAGTRAAIAC
jgi:flagellar biosynthesis protein FlhF